MFKGLRRLAFDDVAQRLLAAVGRGADTAWSKTNNAIARMEAMTSTGRTMRYRLMPVAFMAVSSLDRFITPKTTSTAISTLSGVMV